MALQNLTALGGKEFVGLETFTAPGQIVVHMVSDEVTALCPITQQPDFYTVSIEYTPDKLCLESKSLKLYLHSLRNEGVFCEQLAVNIKNEIERVLKPKECKVQVTQKARGGITIIAQA